MGMAGGESDADSGTDSDNGTNKAHRHAWTCNCSQYGSVCSHGMEGSARTHLCNTLAKSP